MQNLLKKASIKQKYIMFCIMLLAIISIIEFFVAFASSAYNVSSPLGTYNSSVYSFLKSGSGTSEQDPYIIANEDEFYQFCNCVNDGNDFKDKYVKLTTDLELSSSLLYVGWWTRNTVLCLEYYVDPCPIVGRDKNCAFKGTFDGGNHYIYNFSTNDVHLLSKNLEFDPLYKDYTCYYEGPYNSSNPYDDIYTTGPYGSGLFGYIDGATIKNVYLTTNISRCEIDYDDTDVENALKTKLSNKGMTIEGLIQNVKNIKADGVYGTFSGGIVGKATGAIHIENCKNYGIPVIGRHYGSDQSYNYVASCAGGIVGDASEASGTIEGCLNYGIVDGDNAGGIVGTAGNNLQVKECFNHHSAYSDDDTADVVGVNVGGICGFGGQSFTDCGNTGTLKNTLGSLHSYSVYLHEDSNGNDKSFSFDHYAVWKWTYTYTYNWLELEIRSRSSGGIVGYTDGVLTNCYSTAENIGGSEFRFYIDYSISCNLKTESEDYGTQTTTNRSSIQECLLSINTASTGLGGGKFENCYTTSDFGSTTGEVNTAYTTVGLKRSDGYESFKYSIGYDKNGKMTFEYGIIVNSSNNWKKESHIMLFGISSTSGDLHKITSDSLKSLDLGSNWVRSASINDGYPHLKRFYWEDNAGLDGADFGG